ncbi:hypothetical protein DKP76_00725 [Falsochrobactrum shanghaiense]|uniref:DUF937 domain-containing protein n=1 Tax=Falsochrobactrum shanghaiense TaxID=2201899 RepID=A0A316JB75_9HYPH|nr:YidB family protein [Falsochrobactrum shanghaiense]PWL19132.1 hypothetical protein DKP76_00725 [Falsochrobactrum shanghaiense]
MVNSDDSSNNSPIPGGSLAKPVLIALGALLVGRMLKGNSDEPEQPASIPGQPQGQEAGGGLLGNILGGLGGLLGGAAAGNASPASEAAPAPGPLSGGLGGLLEQLAQAGHGDKVDSWLGQGDNAQIEPGQLGDALGQKTLSEIAQHAGIDQQELLNQLSQVLPGLVDKLTAGGKVPDTSELSRLLQNR